MTDRWRQYPACPQPPFPKRFLQLPQASNDVESLHIGEAEIEQDDIGVPRRRLG